MDEFNHEQVEPKNTSKTAEVTIRLLKSAENRSAELLKVSQSAFEYPLPWEVSFFDGLIKQDHVLALIAEYQRRIVAFLIVGISLDEAEIYNIAVTENLKRQGLATRLMQECKRQLSKNGVKSIFLEVRSSNLPAQTFYKSQGFELVGLRKNYYKHPSEDALVLKCEL